MNEYIKLDSGKILFSSIPKTPSTAPTEDYEMANKKYVDDQTVEALPAGVILPYGASDPPLGYLLCDGSEVSRETYLNLFAIIGTAYGSGDGSTTFNLPNLKGKIPVGKDSADGDFDTLGKTGGAKTHTLTVDEMPSHNHSYANFLNPSGTRVGWNGANGFQTTVTENTGGGQAHNNLQPYITLNYIIKY